MASIDHVTSRVADLTAGRDLYSLVFELLGFAGERHDGAGFHEWNDFYRAIAPPAQLQARDRGDRLQLIAAGATFSILEGPPSENLHLAIGAGDNGTIAEFHRAGLGAGGRDNGGPGERPRYHPGYYAAYLLDPDGNNVELVNHNRG